jgi:23S rRNA pseudouridine1911/1915/1917 synthase
MAEPLPILFEDAHCLAVVKAAGVLTQGRSAGAPTLEESVRNHLRPEDPDSVYLGTVHRLDRPVSGVVIWAKTPRAARRLAAQFAARQAQKEYWAIVEADPSAPLAAGRWEDRLLPPDPSGVVRAVAEGASPFSKPAVTRFSPALAAQLPPATLWLRLWPETGRTHQLRVQTARRGLPILGDALYGSSRPFPAGIALHARSLTVSHPILRTELRLVAPVPEAWRGGGIILPEETGSST